MQRDWLFHTDSCICSLRAAGILISHGRILLQRERGGQEYAVPGGHVKIGETTDECLVREYDEEMGIKIKCLKQLWSEECLWSWEGTDRHSITFYKLISLDDGEQIPDFERFMPQLENPSVEWGWVPLDRLNQLVVYPRFLHERIMRIEGSAQHFVTRES